MIELALTLPLSRFSLAIEASLDDGVTAVMGPSGSGKTSLLEAVAGLRSHARGRIVVGGDVLLDTERGIRVPPERRRVGYVPQDAGLFPHLTAGDNVGFGARVDDARRASLVDVLEIGALLRRYPASLSGGEKQRVALARALATAPRLLLLDEPLAALDVELRERIVPYLLRIRDEWGIPMIHVTHNVGEALTLARSVLLLRDGRLEGCGAPFELLSTPVLAREAEAGIENLLAGQVASHDAAGGNTRGVLGGGVAVAAPLAAARAVGSRVLLAIRAEDVLVSVAPVRGVSARNTYAAKLLDLERSGADVILRCVPAEAESPWLVRLTPAAVEALGLGPGATVWLAVKSHSVRWV
jgi:molybdate transport system ATP-binding protein